MTGYDVVVVGAGTAGSVVAARLSEDPARTVLLLEAGPVPRRLADVPPELLDARRVPGAEPDGRHNRWFPVRLAPGRDWSVSRGRVGGGSSATNGTYFVRARPADFARWAALDPEWSPKAVAPLLAGLERDLDFGDRGGHGAHGPMPVRRAPLSHPLAAAFAAAAMEAGHPFEEDKNGQTDAGIGAMPANASAGVRFSTALAYLLAALGRPNLTVRPGATVERVRVDRGRVIGLHLADGGYVAADRIVLAAGALTTPEILLRSGVGPASDLLAAGVPVVVDAPGVGAQLADHPQVVVDLLPRHRQTSPIDGWTGALLDTEVDGATVEVLQSLVPMSAITGEHPRHGSPLPLLVSVHAPVAPGSVRLDGAGLSIDHGYLRTSQDRSRMREAVRRTVDVVQQPALRAVARLSSDLDGTVLADDRALDAWVAAHLGTALHTCSTVPFRRVDGSPGPVNAVGGVIGIDGLVVADTSILPTAPSRGPANTAVLIGEMAARALV